MSFFPTLGRRTRRTEVGPEGEQCTTYPKPTINQHLTRPFDSKFTPSLTEFTLSFRDYPSQQFGTLPAEVVFVFGIGPAEGVVEGPTQC